MTKHRKIAIYISPAAKTKLIEAGRTANGFGLVEAFTSAIFIVVAVIVSLDCWFMIMAARLNDSACRDAARAASQAGTSSSDALNAAIAAANSYNNMGTTFMVSPPTIQLIAYNNSNQPQTMNGSTMPPLSVTIQSTCTVRTLVPVSFLSNSNLTFTDTKTYPIVPSTAGVQAGNIPAP